MVEAGILFVVNEAKEQQIKIPRKLFINILKL